MGPVPKWGLYFYWLGARYYPRGFLTAPFIRLTCMPVTQSSGNSYLFLERSFQSHEDVPRSCGCSHNPFFLEEYTVNTQSPTASHWYPACFDRMPEQNEPDSGKTKTYQSIAVYGGSDSTYFTN